MPALSVRDIHKSFGDTRALAGVSFDVSPGEIVVILGPSGCGKSTLLSVIAALEPPDRGAVLWDDQDLAPVPPHQRGFGLMFQDFALFPHMDVFGNVAFGLQMAALPPDEIQFRVRETLGLVGLPGFQRRDVNSLSGGEQQRVALARSLAPRPRLLMLDEPLGSLDRALRERLMEDLQSILKQAHQTTLYVTHDQEEAYALADRIVVMDAGRVAQIGAPQDLYRYPASVFVARFLGLTNLLSGESRRGIVSTSIGDLPFPSVPDGPLTLLLRPDSALLDANADFSLSAALLESTFRGSILRAVVEVNGTRLTFDFPSNTSLPPIGSPLRLSFRSADSLQLIEPSSQLPITNC